MDVDKLIGELYDKRQHQFLGKYRGIVVDNVDPERLGRLKVHVPSVLGADVVTGWALPCLPFGGAAGQGSLWIPEIGAGVWIEFEEGHVHYPVWVGTFWSKPDGENEVPLPVDADGETGEVVDPPTRRILSTLKSHSLQFEDADGDEMVLLYDGANRHRIVMNADGIKIVDGVQGHEIVMDADGIRVTDGVNAGNELLLNSDGVTLADANGHKLALDSDGVTLESAGDVTIKGTNVTIEADAQLTAKGNPVHLNP